MKLIKRSLGIATLTLLAHTGFSLDLMDTYQLAYYNDPTYQADKSTFLSTKEAFPQARANLLPFVTLTGEVARGKEEMDEGDTLNTRQYRLSLTQRVFHVDDWYALRGANYTVKRAAATFAARQQDLMIRVSEAYFSVLAAQDDLTFATAQRNQLTRQLHQTKERFKVGVVAITDVKEADSRHKSAIAEEIGARNDLENRIEELRAIIREEPKNFARLKRSIPLVKPTPENMETWAKTAEQQDYDLKASHYAVREAEQAKYESYAKHLPTAQVATYYQGRDEAFQRAQSATPFAKGWEVALQGELPIFEGLGTQSRAKQAGYDYVTALHNFEAERRSTLNNTRNAYRGVVASISQVQALRKAVASAKTALEATEAGFSVGTKTNVDVIDRIADLFRQRQLYAQSRYAYVLNTLQLKREAGILSSKDLQEVNQWLVRSK